VGQAFNEIIFVMMKVSVN